jgi:hypothetical protein
MIKHAYREGSNGICEGSSELEASAQIGRFVMNINTHVPLVKKREIFGKKIALFTVLDDDIVLGRARVSYGR